MIHASYQGRSPVVESLVSLIISDHAIRGGFIPSILKGKKND